MNNLENKLFCILAIVLLVLLCSHPAMANTKMAITVDDLPVSGPLPPNMTRIDVANQFLAVFKKHHITGVYGFINGINAKKPEDYAVLQAWVNNGQLLGNHTYTHSNPRDESVEAYIRDIKGNDPLLAKLMGDKDYKYFRYPFLSEGNTPAKRNAIRQYLFSHGYKIAPVTVDFADWQFNPAYGRCTRKHNQQAVAWLEKTFLKQGESALNVSQATSQALFHRDMDQVLLIHIAPIDAKMLDQLLTAYEKQGVTFVPLPTALADNVYRNKPTFEDAKGFTYLYQLLRMHGMKGLPRSASKYYVTFPEKELATLCKS